jgi:mono/diheme cytochrome c family protein
MNCKPARCEPLALKAHGSTHLAIRWSFYSVSFTSAGPRTCEIGKRKHYVGGQVMNVRTSVAACTAFTMIAGASLAIAAAPPDSEEIARGKYLVTISGCNDCHTPGYMQKGPTVPESEWLTGLPVGFQGPWGTTYPANLRLTMQRLDEPQWLKFARQERLPPMPWFNLAKMTDDDLKAVYAYVRSLGAPGAAVPAYVAPGGKVTTPFFVFVPQDAPESTASDTETASDTK